MTSIACSSRLQPTTLATTTTTRRPTLDTTATTTNTMTTIIRRSPPRSRQTNRIALDPDPDPDHTSAAPLNDPRATRTIELVLDRRTAVTTTATTTRDLDPTPDPDHPVRTPTPNRRAVNETNRNPTMTIEIIVDRHRHTKKSISDAREAGADGPCHPMTSATRAALARTIVDPCRTSAPATKIG